MDSVEISLLTCQPHDEVYSLYGHTAIRYHDMHKKGGVDAAFNYGVFNFNAPHFVARFVFGLTDYELGAFPYHLFQSEYRHFGSMVTEQVLNLTAQEKWQLRQALSENLRPENRIYRYNYFYNNCTTKARDIIEQCINGKVEYAGHEDYTPTYRDMVHEMTQRNPWARWGNDLLLGIKADQPTTQRQQEFLPHNLLYDFDRAQIYANGNYRPLVKERRIAVPAGVQMHEPGFPLSPLQCFIALLAVGLVLFIIQWRMHRIFVAMGSPADVGNRYDRYCTDTDVVLATPHRKSQSANHSVQSPALAVPLARYQRQKDCLLAHHSSIVLPVPDRRPIPVVCRGHLEFGIMFAATKCTSY